MNRFRNDIAAIFSLFTSFSTLLCCALPAMLVALGLGAVMAGLVTSLPFLVTLTKYKEGTLLFAAAIIGVNFWLVYGRAGTNATCTIPENSAETACETASKWSKIVLWISFAFLFIGAVMTYLALPLLRWLES